ncbi:SKIP/SNW domain-containing protein [Lophiotrema nucula]|uniref:Pre-mRNA-processing protein 45 n=1 Tax=Lophiotrema nucula TaxID=690887 RepID=A0A6A5Z5S1_9PLEO|nr:SKIP/SNW domain-containing protein [Lophiotrema nucula]
MTRLTMRLALMSPETHPRALIKRPFMPDEIDSNLRTRFDSSVPRGPPVVQTQSSLQDLIPLRQSEWYVDLKRPSREETEATTERTRKQLAKKVLHHNSSSVPPHAAKETSFHRYVATGTERNNSRLVKVVNRQHDPFVMREHRYKKIPRAPPSPPRPVLHPPSRPMTVEEREAWDIPPAVSNWKNNKGYAIPLDKRMVGHMEQEVTISDKFAHMADSLAGVERLSRQEVHERAILRQEVARRVKDAREKELCERARSIRANAARRRRLKRSRSLSSSSGSEASADEDLREQARIERRREMRREVRQSRMGSQRRAQMLDRGDGGKG